jgi:soluble lytic murein transglycosylase
VPLPFVFIGQNSTSRLSCRVSEKTCTNGIIMRLASDDNYDGVYLRQKTDGEQCMRRFTWVLGIVLMALSGGAAWLRWHISAYDHVIMQAAARNDLDFYLVKALVFEESWFRSDIRGGAGEVGLMQVTMAAANDFTAKKHLPALYPERLAEPELNAEIGCWYLRQSVERYKNAPDPILFALLRYNAGETRADSWLRAALSKPVPQGFSAERYYLSLVDFPKTRTHVSNILRRSRSHNYWF